MATNHSRAADPSLPNGQAAPVPADAPAHRHDHDHDGEPVAHSDLCCSHHEMKIERWILLYLIGGVLVLTTTLSKFFGWINADVATIPAALGAILLGAPLIWAAAQELRRGRPTSSTLAALAIIAALAIGKYETAGFLAFILLVADQVVRRTAWGAQRAIEQLVRLTPDIARIVEGGQEREVSLREVREGMTVRVRPGENLPVDGVVTKGSSDINQASLTGESVPVEVQSGAPVYAGTTNLTGVIDLRVTGVGADTTIGKVTQLIHEAESRRTPRQMLIEQVAAYFVPVAITVAGLVLYFTRDVETAITVLVVVCPSALLLSSPTAMVAAFASAARLGILIKQTSYLEAASHIDTVVLDKTGTLTTGVFAVSRLAPATGVEGADLLQAAADAEHQSNHPLAKSIVTTARQARIEPESPSSYTEVHGRGVKAMTTQGEILAGRADWLVEINPSVREEVGKVNEKIHGMSGVHVMRDGQYLGAVGLEDKLRPNAKSVIDRLRDLGSRRVAIFTGDRQAVAERVGAVVGVDMIEAECLPEQKLDRLQELVDQGQRVLMVGDGINDGPCLATADVGVAMGLSGSDIATNSAGVALMTDDLSRVPFLIELARRTRAIVAQNIVMSIVIAIFGLVLAATGSLTIWFAAFYHFVADVFVIGNSFRLIRFGEEAADESARVLSATEPPRRRAQEGGGSTRAIPEPATAGATA
ncbi:MAG: cation-translocating P-type ATPase [Planctomycetota bacterium]|nr:cation-translocating P-type ATPase [Planctomycetota bacterium]